MSQTSSFSLPIGPVHVALEEPVYFHLDVDGETVRKVEITSGHVHRGMEGMAPFGPANMRPVFLTRGVVARDPRIIGSTGDHLKFRIADPRNPQVELDAIAFKQGGKLDLLRSGQPISLLYTVEENHFNGRTTLQLNVKDMKPGVEHVLETGAAAQPETAST